LLHIREEVFQVWGWNARRSLVHRLAHCRAVS
jgi:hypothetical protein